MSVGFVGSFLLNIWLEESYSSKKIKFEKRLEKFLNKKIDLGNYSGIRLFGISLENPKIIDKDNLNSLIKAKNIYIGIMPIRSFLNQRWIIKIKPDKTEINADKDFFKINTSYNNKNEKYKSKINYDLNINFNKYAILKLNDLQVDTKVKGDLIYKSNKRQIIGNIKSNLMAKVL